jgi:hypothetical protein
LPWSGWLALYERGNFKRTSPISDLVFGPAKAAAQFRVVHGSKQLDFARRPAARWYGQSNTPALTLVNDFLYAACKTPGEDGIGRSAELFYLGSRPRHSTTGSNSAFSEGHGFEKSGSGFGFGERHFAPYWKIGMSLSRRRVATT